MAGKRRSGGRRLKRTLSKGGAGRAPASKAPVSGRRRTKKRDVGIETAELPTVTKPRKRKSVRVARVPTAPAAGDGPHAELRVEILPEYDAVPGGEAPIVGALVEIEATGDPIVDRQAGPVAHVILAIDVSASMNQTDKWPVVRQALSAMLRDLRADDAANVLVSVIVFSKGAEVLISATRARDLDSTELIRSIERSPLCFDRYTDVAGALKVAGRIAKAQVKAGRSLPVRIQLLTDGRPQDVDRARRVTEVVGTIPCDLDAFAFGVDADVELLQELLAGRRGGTVKSVRRETLGGAFVRLAEVAQRVVATRCQVEIELAPGVVGGDCYRYRPARVRFPSPAFEDGKRFSADLGTIESGRTYTLLFEFRPPETSEAESPIGKVTLRIPGYGGKIETSARLVLPRHGLDLPEPHPDVRTARDILDALEDRDPSTALRALELRRKLYERERRDPGLLALLDRAIRVLRTTGTLDSLTRSEQATLRAHTCTGSGDAWIDELSRAS